MKHITVVVALTLALAGCAAQPAVQAPPDPSIASLDAAVKLMRKNRNREAVDRYLAPMVADCVAKYAGGDERFYVARSPAEAVMYMVMAAADENRRKASVVATPCADAHFMLGYAHLELGDLDEAERQLNIALDWTPHNSQYLSELGHIQHVRKDWNAALALFNRAVDASAFSPAEVKNEDRARALRGVGYSLIELGDLDEAEKRFEECLELDPHDVMALNELAYIRTLRGN